MPSSLKLILIFLLFHFISFIAWAQTFTSSNLPIVIIDTNGQTIIDDPKIFANMGIIWNGPGKRNALTDPMNNYNGKIGIEIRGSSSQMFPKKSYGISVKSNELVSIDASLLDMPAENDWILYAPYTDKTMIRDVLTYTLDASLGHYSPRCRFVELFLNGNYQGVYVLMEKIKRNKKRVDIAKLTLTDNSGENLTGGYIIKIDKTTGSGGDGWVSDYSNFFNNTYYQYEYPKAVDITSYQKTYIQTWVRNLEKAIYLEKFTGTGSYHEYLNDSSFIDFMIISEMTKNMDAYRLSSFFYKGKNGLMNCGPIWDFNIAYGNADYYEGWNTLGFQYESNLTFTNGLPDNWQNPFWWKKLMLDPDYVIRLKKRWNLLRRKELSDQRISFVTDSLTTLLTEAKDRNYQRWPILGIYVWPNYYVGNSYDSEVNWMKNWITRRLYFLDQKWPYNFDGDDNKIAVNSLLVFPNPFKDHLNIQLDTTLYGDGNVEIFRSDGALMRKYDIVFQNGLIQLEFSGFNSLNPGFYVLRTSKYGRILLVEKIVKR